ncbi:hypothetical protein [Ammoniphilus sp. CFH 90114]|uniref:hypothetical protein n=1 Tax=Ammoniphilus sp. CFH 90114 TaxID=2493665 RepID=UPI00100FD05E|nr:hypothetical protein [Ammoniphilus sp. CFH 90114]RXT03611.1 hypothetical protein EIZ39_23580 [Ammoniphilus sp. CFH 90114]
MMNWLFRSSVEKLVEKKMNSLNKTMNYSKNHTIENVGPHKKIRENGDKKIFIGLSGGTVEELVAKKMKSLNNTMNYSKKNKGRT